MAGRRRGAGPLWALGGAALGLCLARVAGQLVEVRRGGAEGPGRGEGGGCERLGRGFRGRPSDCELAFSLPTVPADLDSRGDTALLTALGWETQPPTLGSLV